jgi:hypothetical protein
VISADALFSDRRDEIIALAKHYSVPTMYEWRDAVAAGGLISYGTRRADAYTVAVPQSPQPSGRPGGARPFYRHTKAARELSRAACAMNCRDCGGVSGSVRRLCRITSPSDLFDSCFSNSGLHFLDSHLSITSASTANLRARPRRRTRRVRIGPDVQAILCRRRHQPRRPALAKIRSGSQAPTIGPGQQYLEECPAPIANSRRSAGRLRSHGGKRRP